MGRRGTIHIAALGMLAAYFMVWPVWRAQFPIEIWFTESWNAYHQDAVAAGLRLYPTSDQLIVNNYPPLSFFAIGALSKVFGDPLYVGRALSLVGLLAVAVEIAVAVRLLAGAWVGGVLGALWFIAIMAHNSARYVGANDPQISGLAVMGAALVWFIARDRVGKAVEPALLLMVLAGFWKHNNIGIPLSALTWLLLKDPRAAARPILISSLAAAAGLAACGAAFGPEFFTNLLTPRQYGLGNLLAQVGHLQWVALAVILWAIWAAADRGPTASFTAVLIAWGLFSCLLQWLGHGVFGNAAFDLLLAAGIGIGVALVGTPSGVRRDIVIALLALRLVASGRQESAEVLFKPEFRQAIQAQAQAREAMSARIAAIPGPVFCIKDNLLCRAAGKAFVVDDFVTDEMVATGRYTQAEVDRIIRERGITVIEDGVIAVSRKPVDVSSDHET